MVLLSYDLSLMNSVTFGEIYMGFMIMKSPLLVLKRERFHDLSFGIIFFELLISVVIF